jgi:hypothetical protein
MLLQELIEKTKKNSDAIRSEHAVLKSYQECNPWIINEVLEQMESNGHSDIPTFENAIRFKEDLLIDDLSKVYRQLRKSNPNLIERGDGEKVYFYSVGKNFYKKQLKKGFELGDRDNFGYLVSGSNLIIEVATVGLHDFLESYYMLHN